MSSIIGAKAPSDDEEEEITLDVGDKVNVGISSLYRHGGLEMWLKVGVDVTVRPGEDAQETFDRGFTFCVAGLTDAIDEFKKEEV
ncbi:hypothetical protein UFOVP1279_30 [uncultured Caudovirales phage]|uniref:Uncharacterized protein n=1 Tax=uncultured Caudovirales phage TaxID=2100421 RepID=A0A6J5RC38_9CAUD|nr:hypothetical protein UFOVP1279_30 [uncultured Caudovirales phage]